MLTIFATAKCLMNARRVFCLCILVITPRYHSTYRCNAAERNNYFNSRIFDTSICNAQQKYITRQFDNQLDTNWWIGLHLSYSRKSFDLRNIFTNLVFDLTSFMLHYFFTSPILVLETLPRSSFVSYLRHERDGVRGLRTLIMF